MLALLGVGVHRQGTNTGRLDTRFAHLDDLGRLLLAAALVNDGNGGLARSLLLWLLAHNEIVRCFAAAIGGVLVIGTFGFFVRGSAATIVIFVPLLPEFLVTILVVAVLTGIARGFTMVLLLLFVAAFLFLLFVTALFLDGFVRAAIFGFFVTLLLLVFAIGFLLLVLLLFLTLAFLFLFFTILVLFLLLLLLIGVLVGDAGFGIVGAQVEQIIEEAIVAATIGLFLAAFVVTG